MRQENIDVITMGIPSKGVLNEGSVRLLAEADINYSRDPKQYVTMAPFYDSPSKAFPMGGIRLAFMRPIDIAKRVETGDLDLGITGGDVRDEVDARKAKVIQALDFGRCDLVLAADQLVVAGYKSQITPLQGLWRPCNAKRQELLDDCLIGTPFPRLARANLEKYGVKASIYEVDGASEGLVRLGWANAIVDLTESGTALSKNGLAVMERFGTYQAELIATSDAASAFEDNELSGSNRFLNLLITRLLQGNNALYAQNRRKEKAINES